MMIAAAARKGGESVVVGILPPADLPQGGHLATNPTVGIGARQMPPGRVVGPVRSRALLARIPPIPALSVGGDGLMKGTPGNTLLVMIVGGAVRLVILPPARIHSHTPVFVVSGRSHHTLVVSKVTVTTTRAGERRGRWFGLALRLTHVPSDTPNTVRVHVTAIMADTMVMIPTVMTLVSGAAAPSDGCPIIANEGVAGPCANVEMSGAVPGIGRRGDGQRGGLP
jgi:hypothetical protein